MHFLLVKDDWREIVFGRPWAMVAVQLVDKEVLQIQEGGIGVARGDTKWAQLPARMKVVDLDGKAIKPSKGRFFWVTTETFNPFHGLCEAGEYGPER